MPEYRCLHCGERFDEPDYCDWDEPMPFGYYEHWSEARCPYCGDTEIYYDMNEEGAA